MVALKTLEEVLKDWEAVIGLEVHAELTSLNTKLFCGCKLEFGAEPNTRTCPVCLGLPGALPVPNKAAVESIVLAGLATNCTIEKRSMFYRKNYMYPDMSKNFQTTQGPVAFCMGGYLDLEVEGLSARERVDVGDMPMADAANGTDGATVRTEDGYATRIGVTRIHLEEDAGKMVHVGGSEGRIAGSAYSLVDYNRAGTPLIELVTEPDLRTPEEARLFMQKLRQIYLALGISDCSMEKGSLRCDGNVSLRRRGETSLGVKTELKNVNSFKNLHDGLAFEICRQAEVLERGDVVLQETRHWDPSKKVTIVMRTKETADDYRLFPEPDLAPFDLSDEFVEAVRAKLPELPDARAARFADAFGVTRHDARLLVEDGSLAAFFDSCMELVGGLGEGESDAACEEEAGVRRFCGPISSFAKPIANMLVNDVAAWRSSRGGVPFDALALTPARMIDLAKLMVSEEISISQAREVLAAVLERDRNPLDVVEERGLRQISDEAAIASIVHEVLDEHPDKVAQYRSGKVGLMGFFVGQCMRRMAGKGNPRLISKILEASLAE